MFYTFDESLELIKSDKGHFTLGNKGISLVNMYKLQIPVPCGVILSTDVSVAFLTSGYLPDNFDLQLKKAMCHLEQMSKRRFFPSEEDNGGFINICPLLVSVRSGAPVSMPGMMDTILNVGCNDISIQQFALYYGDDLFAYKLYLRFLCNYACIVCSVPKSFLSSYYELLHSDQLNQVKNAICDVKKSLLSEYAVVIPQCPKIQIRDAIIAVMKSWKSGKAIAYRDSFSIDDNLGTAVILQVMVFGDLNDRSCSGVVFSRNPNTGDKGLFGEFVIKNQCDVIVSGAVTPLPLNSSTVSGVCDSPTLVSFLPACYRQLEAILSFLESHYKGVQEVEFTVECGILYILQSRSAQCSAAALVKVLVDLVHEKVLTPADAIMRITPKDIESTLHPLLENIDKQKPVVCGCPASLGVVSGHVCLTIEQVMHYVGKNQKVVLACLETTANDITTMKLASAIITKFGGMTSHAAVVLRGMNKSCVSGIEDLYISPDNTHVTLGKQRYDVGDVITVDGNTGRIFSGRLPVIMAQFPQEANQLLSWADDFANVKVYANADNVEDVRTSLSYGACGVGLCRTEHMILCSRSLSYVQAFLLSGDDARKEYITEVQDVYYTKFVAILESLPNDVMCIVRLLDAPLHEFLPSDKLSISNLANILGISVSKVYEKVSVFRESSPMLGLRGVRFGLTYPDFYRAQLSALFQAMHFSRNSVRLGILLPMVSTVTEVRNIADMVGDVYNNFGNLRFKYQLGAMIETPRSAMLATDLVSICDFFSFGTNDLTQMTFGISRDDAKFLPHYVDTKLLFDDPFVVLDIEGVGKIINNFVNEVKKVDNSIFFEVCGEQIYDAKSLEFIIRTGVQGISCSPYRVPVMRLLLGQEGLKSSLTS